MRRFLRDVSVFLLLQLAVLVAVDAAYMHYEGRQHYLAGFLDKSRRLAETPSPRILLVGGSSAAFGVNSTALQRVSGRPVVNLGLNAGLGLRFILAQAAAAVRPGDLVVLTPEYALLERGEYVDPMTMLQVLRLAPGAARFVPPCKVPALLDNGLAPVTQSLRALAHVAGGPPVRHPYYARHAFDAHGDVVAHLEFGSSDAGHEHVRVPATDEAHAAGRWLQVFARHVRERGAAVVIVPPPIPGDDYGAQREQVRALWAYVEERSGIQVVGAGKTYGREMFLDTSYHLTRWGRQVRSREVIRLLRTHFTPSSSAETPEG